MEKPTNIFGDISTHALIACYVAVMFGVIVATLVYRIEKTENKS